jgi:hypothetical protein
MNNPDRSEAPAIFLQSRYIQMYSIILTGIENGSIREEGKKDSIPGPGEAHDRNTAADC